MKFSTTELCFVKIKQKSDLQSLYKLLIGVCINGVVVYIYYHAGFCTIGLFDIFHFGVVYRHAFGASCLAVISRKRRCLKVGSVRHFHGIGSTYYGMRPVNTLCVEPYVRASGQFKCDIVVLYIILTYVYVIAVITYKMHWGGQSFFLWSLGEALSKVSLVSKLFSYEGNFCSGFCQLNSFFYRFQIVYFFKIQLSLLLSFGFGRFYL